MGNGILHKSKCSHGEILVVHCSAISPGASGAWTTPLSNLYVTSITAGTKLHTVVFKDNKYKLISASCDLVGNHTIQMVLLANSDAILASKTVTFNSIDIDNNSALIDVPAAAVGLFRFEFQMVEGV